MGIAHGRVRAGEVTAAASLAAVMLWFGTACEAATVTIRLKDSSGITISQCSVALFPTEKPLRSPTPGFDYRWPSAATDSSGVAVIQNVPAGPWAVYVGVPRGRNYLSFALPGIQSSWGEPQVPSPRLTITSEDEKVSLDVTVQRGDTISFRLAVDRDSRPGGTVHMEEVATKAAYEGYILRGDGNRLLPPGRWRVWLEPRPGQLLKSFEVDHDPVLEGASAVIETKGEGRRIDVDWSYVTPCEVTGRFAWDVGEDPPGTVIAHLVRAGDWLDEVQRRGGTITDRIPGAYDRGSYSMFLLDGTWRLTVEGPRVISSDPDHVDLQLAPGDERSADFFVKAKAPDGAESSVLMVKVTSPEGTMLSKAHVAVWRIGDGEKDGGAGGGDSDTGGRKSPREPLMRAETRSDYPTAVFTGLPAGNYRIVAGHADYREGRTIFENFFAKPGSPQSATVVLLRGAEIAAVVKDEKDAPARGVELRAARTGPPPESELDDEDLRKERELRSAVSDETGRMKIVGLDASTYRLEAALTEQRKGTHFVRFEKAAKPGDPLEVTLAEGEKVEVGVRLVPAASVSAHLACGDRAPFPEKIALRALPFPLAAEAAEDPGPRREGVFARDDLVLTGREKDALFAGPLTPGAFAVVLRPDGYDRWTFARGTEDPDRAVPATLEAGATQDLGVIELDCGPSVRVEAELQSQEPAPDLRDASLAATLRVPDAPAVKGAPENASAKPSRKGSSSTNTRSLSPSQEAHAGFIRLRGAPEGSADLSLRISHPYFVPSTIAVKKADLVLERGRETNVRVQVPRLGGAIQFDPSLGAALAMITGGPDAAVGGATVPVGAPVPAASAPSAAAVPSAPPVAPPLPERHPLDEKARAIGILPGRYTVELFADEGATHRLAAWKDVVVEAGKTVRPR